MSNSINQVLSNRQSIIDKVNKYNQSIIDYTTTKLREQLKDDNLGTGMVAYALNSLGEAQVNNIADYALRKGTAPGKLFVTICDKAIRQKRVNS